MGGHLLFVFMSVFLVSIVWAQIGVDVTAPGDFVIGYPDDGDWPRGESPMYAIDDDVNTKYLHFKGEMQPTGFKVTPSIPGTIIDGLTFTTANDHNERDPMTWELYGSRRSIDGTYTLIASGLTFLPEERIALNTSPIEFMPMGPFDHYQIVFPTVRGTDAKSMQIGEIQFLSVPEPVTASVLGLGGLFLLHRRKLQ